MGTQQIFMMVISAIVVGVMIMLGISLFNLNEYNSNKRSLASEMSMYPKFVLKYWETAKLLGGAGGDTNLVNISRVSSYIGFVEANNSSTSDNGTFRVTSASGNTVVLKALGKSVRNGRRPLITTTINLSTQRITTIVSDGTSF